MRLREPLLRGPHVRGPQLKQQNLSLDQLKMPSRGAGAAAPPAPLLPTQAVFRQKPWLPWWVAIVIPLLLLLALLLFLFLPKNVDVPDVVGKKSAFEAEKVITEAGLKLAPQDEGEGRPEGPARHRDRARPRRPARRPRRTPRSRSSSPSATAR